MANKFLRALLGGLAGGAQGVSQEYLRQQDLGEQRKREAVEALRWQRGEQRADEGMKLQREGAARGAAHTKFLERSSIYDALPEDADLAPDIAEQFGIKGALKHTPGQRTESTMLPGGIPSGPGMALGSVEDVFKKPKSTKTLQTEAAARSSIPMLESILSAPQIAGNPIAKAMIEQQITLAKSGLPSTLSESEIFGMNRMAQGPRPQLSDMAAPDGGPGVWAVHADGRKVFVGRKTDKAQNIVFVDADNNQRVVTIMPQYGKGNAGGPTALYADEAQQGGAATVNAPAAPPQPTATAPPKAVPPSSAPQPGAGVGRVIGRAQLPASMRSAVADLKAVKDMADQAVAAGEKAGWGGVGGFGQGKVHSFLYQQAGIGDPNAAAFRNVLYNLFGDIAKERGGSALTPVEMQLLRSYLPTPEQSVEQIKTNLEGIQRLLSNKLRGYGEGEQSPADMGFERKTDADGTVRWVKKGGGE